MTTPQPVDPLVALTHSVRDRAELALARVHLKYWLGIFAALCLISYGAAKAYGWYEGRLARLEGQRSVLEQRAAAAAAGEDIWRVQALLLAEQRRVDTVRTDSIITNTVNNVVTVPIPVPQSDGTTSEIPMQMVPLASFNALGDACTRERHDCTQLVAAKDAQIDSLHEQRDALKAINKNVDEQLAARTRANFWTKITWGSGGAAVGFSTGFAAGAASCRR